MLIIKLLGVAVVVGLVVRWKRMRLPLLVLLVLLLGLLLRSSCSHDASIQPHDTLGPKPAGLLAPVDGGADDPDGGPIDNECPGVPTCGPGN